ncbi:GyrI-like domain-containing protein [Leucobacter sp. CSA2]|uniref:GyrI-like domain-containing protein n=1 Tax=Leucobacter edaphi TaxID=2796472 RepID=A0A934QCN5_9MICO|nr:GyrI-like domain-containing protein [Leucobacter edaphi]MBK0421336.1 GyrI-like domain-containing protein [Leucobacter edaphi]
MAEKVDLKRDVPGYRARVGVFDTLELPPRRYLQVAGHGDPNTAPAFARAIEALYPAAYRLKFLSKNELDRDYVVPPLEGVWWAADMAVFDRERNKSAWNWRLLSLIPDWIDASDAERAIAGAPRVVLGWLAEGRVVQTLHVGSFDDEGPVLARMHDEVIPESGYRMTGLHHEIYLSDFRRVPEGRRRTILRQPVIEATHAA